MIKKIAVLALLIPIWTAVTSGQELGRQLRVPLDYEHPRSGTASLYYEFGAVFDEHKPTVILVADGQQFYIRKGSVRALQESLFGPGFNVVGIVPRGQTKAFIEANFGTDRRVNWQRAWQLFNAEQCIGDIESVRKAVLGSSGKALLYGRSGGAYLVHQYLAVHAGHVLRAFTQSAVSPRIVEELGIGIDRFWSELGAQDPSLQSELLELLRRRPKDRIQILLTLQRQHFYVPADQIQSARARLIHALAKDDTAVYAEARKTYEVDGVLALNASDEIIAQDVRVVELLYPTGALRGAQDSNRVYPLLETQAHFIRPLLDLVDSGNIHVNPWLPPVNPSTEVFVLAARRDEAVDYRTSIALAYCYPHHVLFIADDNHTYLRIAPALPGMIQAFLQDGAFSAAFQRVLEHARADRWFEK